MDAKATRGLFGDAEPTHGTYGSEAALVSALGKPRKTQPLRAPNGNELGKSTLPMGPDGEPLLPEQLVTLRVDKVEDARRARRSEMDEVMSLTHFRKDMSNTEKLGSVARVADRRKERHDAALLEWEQARQQLYADMEAQVLEGCVQLRERLEVMDADIDATLVALRSEDHLVGVEHSDLEASWRQVDGKLGARRGAIKDFGDSLTNLERARNQRMEAALSTMAGALIDIAHVLPPVVERLAEAEAFDANRVIISNRRDYADLVARLEKTHVVNHYAYRRRWEECEAVWRRVRHDDALQAFVATMNSPAYVNPESRQALFAALRSAQAGAQATRMDALDKLNAMLPPATLVSKDVEALREQLEAFDNDDQARNKRDFEALDADHKAVVEAAFQELEGLRATLHDFGALSPEGGLPALGAHLAALLSNEELDAWFRRTGGLKADLAAVQADLVSPRVIYEDHLGRLGDGVDLLVASLDLDTLLEEQGKDGDRKTCQDTIDRIRVARKSDLPPVLTALQRQVSSLAAVAGLHPLTAGELSALSARLSTMVEELEAAKKAGGGTRGSVLGSVMSGGSRAASRAGGPKAPTRVPSKAGSRASGGSRGTRGTRASVSSAATTGIASVLNMADVREVQRRVGAVVNAADLPDDFKAVLRDTQAAVATQRAANTAVDGVLSTKCEPLINARDEDGQALLRRAALFSQNQAGQVQEACEALCMYVKSVGKAYEEHVSREKTTDEYIADELNGATDDFEEANLNREADMDKALTRLRRAPNADELEARNAAVLEGLSGIERGYRGYHKEVLRLAQLHPKQFAFNTRAHRRDLCTLFGLVLPNATEVDGEPQPGEAGPVGLDGRPGPVVPEAAPEGGAAEEGEAGDEAPAEAAAEEGSGGDDDAAAAMEALPELVTAAGTTYRVRVSVEDIVRGVVAPEEEVAAGAASVVAPTEDGGEGDGKEGEGEGEGGGEGDGEAGSTVEGEGKGGEGDAGPRLEDEAGAPLDPTGARCVEPFEVPAPRGVDVVSNLRDVILAEFDTTVTARKARMAEMCTTRTVAANDELEDRLRRHWPRKGKAEVTLRQPRDAELIAHSQKLDRHVRKFRERNTSHAAAFADVLEAAKAHAAAVAEKQAAIASLLPSQKNLAALLGVQQKSKSLCARFKAEAADWLAKMGGYVDAEPGRLLQSNADFLRTCVTFDEGGDYDTEEVGLCGAALQEVEAGLQTEVDGRQEGLKALQEAQHAALDSFGEPFSAAFDDALQVLSMREGLGKKYGAPRRNAQAVIRSQIGWSDAAEGAITAKLEELQALAGETPGQLPRTPTAPGEEDAAGFPLSVRMQAVLVQLRSAVLQRAKFLGALVDDLRPLDMAPVVPADEPPAGDGEEDGKAGGEEEPAAPTFMDTVGAAIEGARKETKDLFAAEGKPIASDDDLPEALKVYLSEQEASAEKVRENSARNLRSQVSALQDLLGRAPAVAVEDVVARCSKARGTDASRLMKEYKAQAGALKAARRKHMDELVPQLADPNEAGALKDLVDREAARVGDAKAAITAGRSSVLDAHMAHGKQAQARLLHTVSTLLTLADSCLMVRDFAPLPGDELDLPQPMSLKRLRKQMRRLGDDADGDVDLKALRNREWAGLDLAALVLPPAPAWAGPPEPEPEPEPEPVKGKGKAAPKGKGKGKAAAEEEPETPPGFSASVTSLYTPASRRLMRTRDAAYGTYLAMFQEDVAAAEGAFAGAWAAEGKWETSWAGLVESLSKTAAAASP